MTRIDFYLVAETNQADHFACRLIEKAWHLGNSIYVRTRDPGHSADLDQLLWTFRDQAFIPHEISDTAAQEALPVLIGHTDNPRDHNGLLINLDTAVPDCFSRFARVAEVVADTDQPRQAARERYNFYRQRGYRLEHHRV